MTSASALKQKKEEHVRFKASGRKDVINIRAEIQETENRKLIKLKVIL